MCVDVKARGGCGPPIPSVFILGKVEIDYRTKPEAPVLGSIWMKDIDNVQKYDLSVRKERPPKSEFAPFAFAFHARSPKNKVRIAGLEGVCACA